MTWLIDTSVLIDHLRGDPRAVDLLVDGATRGIELWSVTVVRTEILAGMRPIERERTLALLAKLRWKEVSVALADRAGELARSWMRTQPGVDTVDYLLAAGAEELDASLITLNVKHFPMFPSLKAPY